MDFVISREEFLRALERVQGIVDRRNTVPVLANVLIQTQPEGIKVTASDMEITYMGEYKANVSEQGELTLNARQLYDIVKTLPQENVRLVRVAQDWVEVTSGKAYFKIAGLSADQYPALPPVGTGASFHLPAPLLKQMIERTFFSIATDDSRYGLNGAFLEPLDQEEGGGLRIISTDGHRLSLMTLPEIDNVPFEQGILLPRKGLQELKKLCDEFKDAPLEITLAENMIMFKSAGTVFYMRLLEGDFPDYRQVVPQKFQRQVRLRRDQFAQALKRVALLSSEKTHSVRFRLLADGLEISASQQDLGESRELLDAEVDGGELTVGFNAKYFQDALNVMDSEEVVIQLGDSLHPGVLRSVGHEGSMYVIMPMRLE